jgi:starvation-inducible DNA-binding protein
MRVAAATGGDWGTTVAVLEELLIQSIALRDMYGNARRQISGGQFHQLRQMLDDHYKEQLRLIGLVVDRIRTLGGEARVFASDFLQSTQFCRVIRGSRALNTLLRDLLEAHESALSAARPHDSKEPHPWVRDLAVGQVVLANQEQCEVVKARLLSAEPRQRFLEMDVG